MTDVVSRAGAAARQRIPLAVGVGLLIVGALAGYLAGSIRESQRDRHAATAVTLTGRVMVSNVESRWIIFYPDGVAGPVNDADYRWHVVGDEWQDADGTYHSGGGYPPCLAGDGGVEANPRRVELTSIDWDNGSVQPMHLALRVRCFD